MPRLLIVNADDFGLSEFVNEAVVLARRKGTLTSASLMVFGPAARAASAIARDDPELAVGLHVVVGGLPERNPIATALACSLSRARRRRLRCEIEAQFDAFAQLGLLLSHVDGHQHLHAHPAVLPIVIELARAYGAHGIRLPREPLGPNMRIDRSRPAYKLAVGMGLAYLDRVCSRALDGSGLVTCDVSLGSLMSGKMSARYSIRALESTPVTSAELFFHPATRNPRPRDPYGPNTGDLRALLSPALRDYAAAHQWRLSNYANLAREATERSNAGA